MKAILFLLLSTLPALCQPFTMSDQAFLRVAKVDGAAPAACSTSETTNAWDVLLEGFPGGYTTNWTGVGTTNNISIVDSSGYGTYKPAGACNSALQIVTPTDGTETFVRFDFGAIWGLTTNQTDIFFALYIVSKSPVDGNFTILSWRSSTNPTTSPGVGLLRTDGNVFLRANTEATSFALAEGQWYVVKLSYDTAGDADGSSITVWSGGELIGSDAFTRPASTFRYLFVGPCVNLGENEGGTYLFDLISVRAH